MNTLTLLKWRKRFFLSVFVSPFLGIVLVVLMASLPVLLGSENAVPEPAFVWLAVASMLFLALPMLLVWPYWILVLLVVATSKNKGDYKIPWLIAIFFLWLLGAGLWELFGKKGLVLSK